VPDFTEPRSIIEHAIDAGVFPGAVIEVGGPDAVLWTDAAGRLTYARDAAPVQIDTLYDLASLTKVVATTTLAMRLVEAHRLSLSDRVAAWLPEWSGPDRAGVTIRHLLAHSSGLPSWLPLFRSCAGRHAFQRAICALPLEYEPGTAANYSDLGFILLGFIIADAGEASLEAQFGRMWTGLQAAHPFPFHGPAEDRCGPSRLYIGFSPPAAWREHIAPTEFGVWRDRLLVGEVHDENAFALGGVAGHSGLFGTAAGVGAFARVVLGARLGREGPLVAPETVALFTARQPEPVTSRALGWDTMLPTSSCGTRMSRDAFGHTGFTGTSLWIDPRRGVYVVLLTNRVHPSREGDAISRVRSTVHDAVMAQIATLPPPD
jgi:CubicO group peptidase (beta-lactamase class C family)